jgi:hypothetical protein
VAFPYLPDVVPDGAGGSLGHVRIMHRAFIALKAAGRTLLLT